MKVAMPLPISASVVASVVPAKVYVIGAPEMNPDHDMVTGPPSLGPEVGDSVMVGDAVVTVNVAASIVEKPFVPVTV